jgi:hypothetical protein
MSAAGDLLVVRWVVIATAALSPGTAFGSTTVATGVARPALRVDARGNAEVSWTDGGRRHTLLVPPAGRVLPEGRLAGRDVSHAATTPIAFAKVVRRTPDGRTWALQAWPVAGSGPADLRIARWRGTPTKLNLAVESGVLTGRATFHGAAIPRYSRTFAGTRMRVYVYLDGWSGRRWHRLFGVAPRADGSFRRLIPEAAARYSKFRAVVTGPVIGADVAPDAAAVATP